MCSRTLTLPVPCLKERRIQRVDGKPDRLFATLYVDKAATPEQSDAWVDRLDGIPKTLSLAEHIRARTVYLEGR
jgi:hypothetical protein